MINTILVEDDLYIQKHFTECLSSDGEFNLVGVYRDAFEAEKNCDRTVRLILMDVQMPVMNGREAARTIRRMKERPDATLIPIFALSADAFVEDERLSIESGMNGHYAKPVDFQALERNVGAFLENREQDRTWKKRNERK